MTKPRFREGDFIENHEGLIFDVKGTVQPPDRVVAFVRYFPDEKGTRDRKGHPYSKVYSFSDRNRLLREKYPDYLVYDPVFDEKLCEVPIDHVKRKYEPIKKLRTLERKRILHGLEKRVLDLVVSLRERSSVPGDAIGVTGSVLAGFQNVDSDMDAIVYGSTNCRKVSKTLKEVQSDSSRSHFEAYRMEDLKRLFDFRSKDTAMSFEDFVRIESQKAFQGKFMKTDYFIRFVKDWNENCEKYGEIQYKNLGEAEIEAVVTDDSDSIFTPCRYVLEDLKIVGGKQYCPIEEIVSFRGRFCEQAKSGDLVRARGKIEKYACLKTNREHFRLLIGNKPSDYMVPVGT